jgi:hypothetical protein
VHKAQTDLSLRKVEGLSDRPKEKERVGGLLWSVRITVQMHVCNLCRRRSHSDPCCDPSDPSNLDLGQTRSEDLSTIKGSRRPRTFYTTPSSHSCFLPSLLSFFHSFVTTSPRSPPHSSFQTDTAVNNVVPLCSCLSGCRSSQDASASAMTPH